VGLQISTGIADPRHPNAAEVWRDRQSSSAQRIDEQWTYAWLSSSKVLRARSPSRERAIAPGRNTLGDANQLVSCLGPDGVSRRWRGRARGLIGNVPERRSSRPPPAHSSKGLHSNRRVHSRSRSREVAGRSSSQRGPERLRPLAPPERSNDCSASWPPFATAQRTPHHRPAVDSILRPSLRRARVALPHRS